MNKTILLGRARLIGVMLVLFCTAFVGARYWHSSATQSNQSAANKQQFYARIRDGVGREVQLAAPSDSPENVRASVNSVDNFIFKRSGAKLSGRTKTRLAEMEARALSGASRRITGAELNDILATTALERLSTLTNQEIAHVDDTLRGFNAPDLPKKYRRLDLIPRAGLLLPMSSEKFIGRMKEMRDQVTAGGNEIFRGMAHEAVEDNARNRVKLLSDAVPEKFGGARDVVNDKEGSAGITPLQAVLIAYSVASEDFLCDSESNLNKRMKAIQANLTKLNGQNFPSPDGHFAYGANGYLVSSPLDLSFDERTVNILLDHIEERSAS